MNSVVFRVDSSSTIGTGHVMRCLTLAGELKSKVERINFLCRDLPNNITSTISKYGYPLTLLDDRNDTQKNSLESDCNSWLNVSQSEDASECLGQFKNIMPDLVIVDHYGLDADWERIIIDAGYKVIAIDDLVRPHVCSFLFDATYGRKGAEYTSLVSDATTVCTGSEYAIVRSGFYKKREHLNRATNVSNNNHSVLISMGGVDAINATGSVISALKNMHDKREFSEIHVVLNDRAPHYSAVVSQIDNSNEPFIFYEYIEDMATLMSSVTLSIGAPGTTTWERACVGLPSVLIPIADNQLQVARNLLKENIVKVVEFEDIEHELESAVIALIGEWSDYAQRNLKICDGLGAKKIIQRLIPIHAKDGKEIQIKAVTKNDVKIIYEFQTMPETRQYARNSAVPSWEEHVKWMENKLNDPFCYFYVIMHGNEISGVVRLDRIESQYNRENDPVYEISIFVSPSKFRLGLASAALKLVADLHEFVNIKATVLKENEASRQLFEDCGYKRVSDLEYLLAR